MPESEQLIGRFGSEWCWSARARYWCVAPVLQKALGLLEAIFYIGCRDVINDESSVTNKAVKLTILIWDGNSDHVAQVWRKTWLLKNKYQIYDYSWSKKKENRTN